MDQVKQVISIPSNQIVPGAYANRLASEDPELIELAESIRDIGLQCPLKVAGQDGGYVILSGHRRYRACRLVGLREIECFVEVRTEEVRKKVVIAENSLRADLTAIEEAEQIRRWIEDDGLSTIEVAKIHRRSEDWVNRQLALLSWPMDVLEQIHTGGFSVSAGANLAVITDDEYRKYLVRNASENGASARMTAAWLQGWKSMMPPGEAVELEPTDPGYVPYLPAAETPCLICSDCKPPQELSHVLICPGCLSAVQKAFRG